MNRLKTILLGLLLTVGIYAQDSIFVFGTGADMQILWNAADTTIGVLDATGGGGYISQYQAVYDEFDTKPHADTAALQNALVDSLVTNGYWSRMDLLYNMANNTAANALLNWPDPDGSYNLTNVSSTSFTRYEGFTGDGSADYLNTNYSPSSDGDNYSLNSGSLGIYCRNDVTGNYYDIGCQDGSVQASLTAQYGENVYARINTGSATSQSNDVSSGSFYATRTASDAQEIYKNGSSLNSSSAASSSLPDEDLYILARNGDGTANTFSTHQISYVFVMDGITDEEAEHLHDIFEWYLDQIGAGIVD